MKIVITGGAGFVGSNLARRLLGAGYHVTIFDNLSRPGSVHNLEWLTTSFAGGIRFIKGDVRDAEAVSAALRGADVVYHTAAQVAVTSSVESPREDFEVNARGTLNVLEAARHALPQPIVVFTSTNKVYGDLESVGVAEREDGYEFADLREGISEAQALDLYSPYGCSKGVADQYVHDYSRIYGLRTVVFRMSCQYGARQFGTEDQGWVVHFLLCGILDRPLRLFGNGKQVRDILYIDDLADALVGAVERIEQSAGQIFNIGGGSANAISLLQLIAKIEGLLGKKMRCDFQECRPGDQKIFVSDNRKCREVLGWQPKISIDEGLERLRAWIEQNRHFWEQSF